MIFYDHFYFLQQPFKFLPIKSSMRSLEKLTFEGRKVIDTVGIIWSTTSSFLDLDCRHLERRFPIFSILTVLH